jgi:ectoine hydroxylase-related dioxygenase (phytanoyl-CoA dioxygenase family)
MPVKSITSNAEIQTQLGNEGFFLFRSVLSETMLATLRTDLAALYANRRRAQQRNGVAADMPGACHHLLGRGDSMDALVAHRPLDAVLTAYFGGPYILNSFGGYLNRRDDGGYIRRIHRDVRTHTGNFRILANVLIPLDDFTIENGATYFAPKSHLSPEKPEESDFYDGAERLLAHAGDIFLFDSNIWHCAGINQTNAPRRALTLTYSRPFVKQQLDYPKFLGAKYGAAASPETRRILGYDAKVPTTISEFYRPPEQRAYKSDQG